MAISEIIKKKKKKKKEKDKICCIRKVWVVDPIKKFGLLIDLETFLRLRILKIGFVTKRLLYTRQEEGQVKYRESGKNKEF